MGNYVFEEKNLNIDDSSLKAFATSVFNHIYPDVVDVNSERQKYEMMVHVHTMLRCIIPETGIGRPHVSYVGPGLPDGNPEFP